MHKKKIAAVTMAIIILNFSSTTFNVLADEISNNTSTLETNNNEEVSKATISKFHLYNNDKLDAYNEVFKMDNSNILSITNNGGKYGSSTIDKAIDGNLSTHWETGNQNSSEFTNEVIFTLNEVTNLNRIVYAARQDVAKGKGFAEEVEIYASLTDNGDDFRLVTTGEYTGSTSDIVEIKFDSTEFKRIKFKFKKANQNWASASEFTFYKEDASLDEVKNLFTDNSMSVVSEEFNTIDKINALEKKFKTHPLYEQYKENFENARILLDEKKIEATEAKVSRLEAYHTGAKIDEEYSDLFRMPSSNISNISANGGTYYDSNLNYMIDDKSETHWETNTNNTSDFTNEVIFTFEEAEVLDRVAFLARENRKGFPEQFEIYASETSKGETFQKVAYGSATSTNDFIEFKFNPTKFKRLKFKFVKSANNRPFVAEFRFYKQDETSEKINRLFTDNTLTKVSEEFNSLEALNELEESVKEHPLYEQFKQSIEDAKVIVENKQIEETEAKVSRLEAYHTGAKIDEEYSDLFRMPSSNISNISANGGTYYDSNLNYMIDDKSETHWETNTNNTSDFTNEVIFTFEEAEVLDRVAFLARENRKGFPEQFEIYASETSKGETFQKVAYGSATSTNDFIEFKFNPTKFKRLKFKFVKSANNRPFVAEFRFYKQDETSEKINRLFTDNTLSKVSEEYNTIDKLNELEEKAKTHPLYEQFKESIDNAKVVVADEKIEASKANMAKIDYNENDDYNKLYRVSADEIKLIKNNGGHYASQKITNAIDGNLTTYWETGSLNSSSFTNEVEIEFKETVKLNRVVYGARQSDRKGFAEEIEIYASKTSQGDTYQLVAIGSYDKVSGVVEAKFNETEFKRLKFKFKKSDQNSATLNEIMFYKSDAVWNSVDELFTDGTMSAISDKFNSLDKINDLEEIAKTHPLYEKEFKSIIDLAKEIIVNSRQEDVFELEMRGNSIAETNKRKMWGFQDWQVTGLSALAGDTITVYVDVEDGEPTPTLLYRQAATQHGGATTFQLDKGKNVITIPEVDAVSNGILDGTIQGGELFFTNYNSDSQTRTPKVRIEGGKKYPVFVLGKSDENEVIKELEEYVAKINENPETTPNVFAVSGDKSLSLVQATYALDWYKTNNKTPKYTAEAWDEIVKKAMDFWGYDNSSELNSDFDFRIMPMLKNLTGGVFMNAHIGIIGIRPGNQDCIVGADMGWGTMHELGHNFDTAGRTIPEVTNNIMPLYFESINRTQTRITDQNIWENNTYPKVGLDDYSNNELYNIEDDSHLAQLAPLWQLYLYDNSFYGKFERLYRANDYGNKTREDIYKSWVVVASDAMQLDLTEFFARHGIRVSDEVANEISSKYEKPDKKIYYLNDLAMNYEGNGFTENAKVTVKTTGSNGNVKLLFSIDEENKGNVLGYEIKKDGKYIGFTSNRSFVDENSNLDDDAVYTVTPYDIKLNTLDSIEVAALQSSISVNPVITIGLGQEFNAKDYIVAKDMKGNSIVDDVKVDSDVNTSKTGEYEVVYSVEGVGGRVYSAKTKVNVVANKTYLSDMTATSTKNGWGTVRKDKSISGGTISLRRGEDTVTYNKGLGLHSVSEYVYDLEGKDYEYFESYVGADKNSNSNLTSVEFKVYVDGVEKYNSGVMTRDTDQKYVKVDIKGAKELKLVITDAGNGIDADHGDWADAKLFTMESKPEITGGNLVYSMGEEVDLMKGLTATDFEDGNLTKDIKIKSSDFREGKSGVFTIVYTVTDNDGFTSEFSRFIAVTEEEVQLSSLDWKSATIGSGSVNKNKAVSWNTIRLLDENNKVETFSTGIGTHSYSEIVYNSEGYDIFDTWVGIDQHVADKTQSSVVFKVYVDGKLKAETDVMRSNTPKQRLVVDIRNSNEVKLVVDVADNGNTWDHADWANARFLNVADYDVTELEKVLEEAKALDLTLYTEETADALKEAIAKGEEVLTSKEQSVIDEAIKAINTAIDSLVKVDLNEVVNIKDKRLLSAINKELNKNGDITVGDMHNITSLSASGVSDITGLEEAVNLESLNLEYNEVRDLRPLAKLKKLKILNVNNQFIPAGELKIVDNEVVVDTTVYNKDGVNVSKNIIVVNSKDELVQKAEVTEDNFTIDTTDLEKGVYKVQVSFEDENFNGTMLYVFTVK